MSKYEKLQINIDKLKVCYKQPEGLFQEFYTKYEVTSFIDRFDYKLHLINKEDDLLILDVILNDNSLLGTLNLNNSKKYEGLCFFSFANKPLYTPLSMVNNEKHNFIPCIDFIADDLGLEFNTITRAEIAVDTINNLIYKTLKLIRDINKPMYANGKKVDDKKIENYFEVYSRTRKKKDKHPTLYFSMAKEGSPKMRIYDKSEEIKANLNQKEYINEWNNFGNKTTYRCEVVITSNYFKEWYKKYGKDMYPLNVFCDESMLFSLWLEYVDRLVYFKNEQGNKISIIDLI